METSKVKGMEKYEETHDFFTGRMEKYEETHDFLAGIAGKGMR